MENKQVKWGGNQTLLKQKLRNTYAVPYYPHQRTPNSINNNYESKYFLRQTLTCKNGSSEKELWKNKLTQTAYYPSTYSYNTTPKKNMRETVNAESSQKVYLIDKNSRQGLSYSQKKLQKNNEFSNKNNHRFFQSPKNQQGFGDKNSRKQQDNANKISMLTIQEEVTKAEAKQTIDRVQDKFKHYLGLLDNLKEKTKNNQYEKLVSIKKMYQEELEMIRSKNKNKGQNQQITTTNEVNKLEIKQIKQVKSKPPLPKEIKPKEIKPQEVNSKETFLKSSIEALNPAITLENKSIETRTTSNSSINSESAQKIQIKQISSESHISIEAHDPPKIKDFIIFGKKGSGRLGQVLLTVHKKTGAVFALKKIKKNEILQNQLVEYLIKEIRVQATLCNPNVIKIYGVFDDKESVYLILEYAQEGSLDQCMKKRNYHKPNMELFPEKILSFYLRDIMNALSELHSKEIMHRDLKPGNIVITNGVCKLCDFGWATFNPQKQRRTTYCGTLDYAAPEIFKGDTYDLSVDLWQFGVMAYEMATGKLPFYMKSEQQTLQKVMNYNDNLPFPWYTSDLAKDFLLKLLQKNPEKRKSISQMLQHKLIVKYLADD